MLPPEARLEIALGRFAADASLVADHLRQSPVDDQRLAVRAQHDVRRLQVPVQHPAAVGVVDCVADVEKPADQLPELDAPLRPCALAAFASARRLPRANLL